MKVIKISGDERWPFFLISVQEAMVIVSHVLQLFDYVCFVKNFNRIPVNKLDEFYSKFILNYL